VLFEVPPEDEQDDEGFRELTREVAVVKRRSVAGPPTPLTLGDGDGAASAGDDSA
jgi:hypothetical protein